MKKSRHERNISQGEPSGAVVVCGVDAMEDADRQVAQAATGVLARQIV